MFSHYIFFAKNGYDLCLKCSLKLKPMPNLISTDIAGLAHFMKSSKCKRIAILCGAGISRSAGIPDFRSPDGIYQQVSKDLHSNIAKYKLTKYQVQCLKEDTQYIFSEELFEQNPAVLYHVLKDILNKRCRPTLTHSFFRLLQNRSLLKYLFTQNVDGLERYVGIDPHINIEVHGTFLSASCFKCKKEYNIADIRQVLFSFSIIFQM